MSSEAYIFIGRCRFYVGGFKLVHPLSASGFGGSVRAIGGLLPSELPLCSGLESQLSDFLLPFHPIQTDSSDRKKMSQGGPATSGTTLNLSDSSQSQLPATVASFLTSQAHVKPLANSRETPRIQTEEFLPDPDSACVRSLSARMCFFPVYAAYAPSLSARMRRCTTLMRRAQEERERRAASYPIERRRERRARWRGTKWGRNPILGGSGCGRVGMGGATSSGGAINSVCSLLVTSTLSSYVFS